MALTGVAVIGCGRMGGRLAEEVQRTEDARLVGLWDRDGRTAQTLAGRLEVKVFADARSLIHDSSVDAVIVATPPRHHRRYACAAARAKKHVFCEKPMATSLADCDEMIQVCTSNGVHLMIGHLTRFHPLLAHVARTVRTGAVGKPTMLVLRRLGGRWSDGDWLQPWRLRRQESGGALMEINCHELDFMRLTGGEVTQVFAMGERFYQHEADYPDQMLVGLQFSGGALGYLHSSQASAIGSYGGRIDCTNGSIVFPTIFGRTPVIQLCRFGEDVKIIGPEEFADVSPIHLEIESFVAAIRSDVPPPVTGQDGRAVVEIALAAYESMDTQRSVNLPLRTGRSSKERTGR